MSNTGIYTIRNLENHKVYIGSAVDIKKRWGNHLSALRLSKHGNPHLQSSWNKHGEEAFKFEVIFTCCEALLIHHEQRAIDLYEKAIGWDMMYNICGEARSRLGVKNTPEHNAKVSAAKKGRKHSLKSRVKMGAMKKGKPWTSAQRKAYEEMSPEVRAKTNGKISVTLKGNQNAKGYKPTIGQRAKQSAAQRGRKRSPEAVAKTAAANRGRKASSETCAKMRKAQKERRKREQQGRLDGNLLRQR